MSLRAMLLHVNFIYRASHTHINCQLFTFPWQLGIFVYAFPFVQRIRFLRLTSTTNLVLNNSQDANPVLYKISLVDVIHAVLLNSL